MSTLSLITRLMVVACALTLFACAPATAPTGSSGSATSALAGEEKPEGPAAGVECTPPEPAGEDDYELVRDIRYSTKDAAHALDLYIPRWREGRVPVLVLVHGGGWTEGDKASPSMVEAARFAMSLGFAAASVNYRLASGKENLFPAAPNDVVRAVQFLKSRADQFLLRADRIVVAGLSAGGHLAALVPAFAPGLVKGVASFYGPMDLGRPKYFSAHGYDAVMKFLGSEVNPVDPELAAMASPISYVGLKTPPMLLVHGALDPLVKIPHSRDMRAALAKAGRPVTLVEMPELGHNFPILSAEAAYNASTCAMIKFLDGLR
jgi:acetyl esterase/lipase